MYQKGRETFLQWINAKPLASMLVFLSLWGVGVYGFKGMRSDFSPRVWFEEDHPTIQELNRFNRVFQSDETLILGYHHPDGIYHKDALEVINQLHHKAYLLPNVTRVRSIFNSYLVRGVDDSLGADSIIEDGGEWSDEDIQNLKNAVSDKSFNSGDLISADGKMTFVIAGSSIPQLNRQQLKEMSETTHKLVEDVDLHGGRTVIYGSIEANNAFAEVAKNDNKTIGPFILLFIACTLFYLYRSFFVLGVSFLIIMSTATTSIGLIGWFDLRYSNLLAAIPGVLMAICLADTIHLLECLFKNLDDEGRADKALEYALRSKFLPTLLTSITTAIGFFSLAFAEIKPISNLGLVSAIGAMLAWLNTYLVISFSFKFASRWKMTFKPLKDGHRMSDEFYLSYVSWISRHKGKIISLFSFVLILFTVGTLKNEINSDPVNYFSDGVEHKESIKFLRKFFTYGNTLSLSVDTKEQEGIKNPDFLNRLDQLEQWLMKRNDIVNINSIVKDFKALNQTIQNGDETYYRIPIDRSLVAELLFLFSLSLPEGASLNDRVSMDNSQLRLSLYWTWYDTASGLRTLNEIMAKAKELGLHLTPSGNYNIFLRINPLVVATFIRSLFSALVLIFVLLLIVYRSFFIASVAILPNLFSMVTTGFLIWSRGQFLDIGSSITAAICLGISIDDTIHFIAEYGLVAKTSKDREEQVRKTLENIGNPLVSTTLILFFSFLCFYFADFSPSKNLGISTAFTLLMALIADLVLLPAIILQLRMKGEDGE